MREPIQKWRNHHIRMTLHFPLLKQFKKWRIQNINWLISLKKVREWLSLKFFSFHIHRQWSEPEWPFFGSDSQLHFSRRSCTIIFLLKLPVNWFSRNLTRKMYWWRSSEKKWMMIVLAKFKSCIRFFNEIFQIWDIHVYIIHIYCKSANVMYILNNTRKLNICF